MSRRGCHGQRDYKATSTEPRRISIYLLVTEERSRCPSLRGLCVSSPFCRFRPECGAECCESACRPPRCLQPAIASAAEDDMNDVHSYRNSHIFLSTPRPSMNPPVIDPSARSRFQKESASIQATVTKPASVLDRKPFLGHMEQRRILYTRDQRSGQVAPLNVRYSGHTQWYSHKPLADLQSGK